MHTIEKKAIIYNISWEDPREEREALGIRKDEEVILTISSAGCNVLDYLIESPKAIVACDFNMAQIAVLELKLACIRCLTHAEFFSIWGESDYDVFTSKYKSVLRSHLSDEAAVFWDENHDLIKDNFMYAGSSGLAARLISPVLTFVGLTESMRLRKNYPPASVILASIRMLLQSWWIWKFLAPLGGVFHRAAPPCRAACARAPLCAHVAPLKCTHRRHAAAL